MGLRTQLKNFLKKLYYYLTDSEPRPQVERDKSPKPLEVEKKEPVLLDTYNIKEEAKITYVDRLGLITYREIRTEEIYVYDDDVFVVRAYCNYRKAYRTFVSKRIQVWADLRTEKIIPNDEILDYLLADSTCDPDTIAESIAKEFYNDIIVAYNALFRYTGIEDRQANILKVNFVRNLVVFLIEKDFSKDFLDDIDWNIRNQVKFALGNIIKSASQADNYRDISISLMRKEGLKRKQSLIEFVSKQVEGLPSKDSVIQILKDDLLSPSFKINKNNDIEPQRSDELTEIQALRVLAELKEEARQAKDEYIQENDVEKRSTAYRRFEKKDPVYLLSIEECRRQLARYFQNEEYIFPRKELEKIVLSKVVQALTEQEVEEEGDMLEHRLKKGISLALLSFGIKKKNGGWYLNEKGIEVIDITAGKPRKQYT